MRHSRIVLMYGFFASEHAARRLFTAAGRAARAILYFTRESGRGAARALEEESAFRLLEDVKVGGGRSTSLFTRCKFYCLLKFCFFFFSDFCFLIGSVGSIYSHIYKVHKFYED